MAILLNLVKTTSGETEAAEEAEAWLSTLETKSRIPAEQT